MRNLTRILFYFFTVLVIIISFLMSVNVSEYKSTNTVDLKFERVQTGYFKYRVGHTYCIYTDLQNDEYRYKINLPEDSCMDYDGLNNITYSYEKDLLGLERRYVLEYHLLR